MPIPFDVDCFDPMTQSVVRTTWQRGESPAPDRQPSSPTLFGGQDTRHERWNRVSTSLDPARRDLHEALAMGQRTLYSYFQIQGLSAGRAEGTLPDVAAGERDADRGSVGLGCGESDMAAMRLGDEPGAIGPQPRAEPLARSGVFLEEPVPD